MIEIDTERLEIAIKNSMAENFWENIDFKKLINNCKIIDDNTAILVEHPEFYFIFHIETYELLEGKGNDTRISENELQDLEVDECH